MVGVGVAQIKVVEQPTRPQQAGVRVAPASIQTSPAVLEYLVLVGAEVVYTVLQMQSFIQAEPVIQQAVVMLAMGPCMVRQAQWPLHRFLAQEPVEGVKEEVEMSQSGGRERASATTLRLPAM